MMKTVRIKIDLASPPPENLGRIDITRVDATTKEEIQAQMAEDDREAMLDAERYVRRLRRHLEPT